MAERISMRLRARSPATSSASAARSGTARSLGSRSSEAIGRDRSMAGVDQVLGDELMEAQALSFRQAGVSDLFQRSVAHAPARRRLAHYHLGVLEQLELLDVSGAIDHVELRKIERVHEHRSPTGKLAQPRRQSVESGADHRLNRGRNGRANRRPSAIVVRHEHAGGLDDEERIATGAFGDLIRLLLWNSTSPGLSDEIDRLRGR